MADGVYPADVQLAVIQEIDRRSRSDESMSNIGRPELKFIAERFNGGVYGHIETEYRNLFEAGFIEGDIASGAESGNLCLRNARLSSTGKELLGWLAEDANCAV